MSIVFYNTLSRAREVFHPKNPEQVGLYVCGPTVYDAAHIGNARSVVVFDTLYRLLCHLYPRVTYVRNITDIDDKIIDAAKRNGETIDHLTQRTTQKFHADMAALGTLPPTIEPRATDHIPQMIALIQSLINKGYAYAHEGHVLFAVERFATYGCLSGLSLEEQWAGARVEVAPYKQNPADFVLWKPSPSDDPFFPGWESPWGYGRPGWHIECSAMSTQYLDIPFDIHGGGQDLIFPHHENEIAQSCCALEVPSLARFWMHNGILTVNGEKMSKSLGNFVTVDQALSRWSGEVIRWVLLSAHYRQSLDWTTDALLQGKGALDRLYCALRETTENPSPVPLDPAFLETLKDDLGTPRAFAYLHHLATLINKSKTLEEKNNFAARLRACGEFLGFFRKSAHEWFQSTCSPTDELLSEKDILEKIAEREAARAARDFAQADQVRAMLLAAGITLEDGPQGTFWKRI